MSLRIDAHVYSFPERLRALDFRLGPEDKLAQRALWQHPESPQALALTSPEAILGNMDEAGVDHSVLIAMPFANAGRCHEVNQHVLEQAAKTPRFSCMVAVQPSTPGWEKEAEAALDQGALGLKINPTWQHLDLSDDSLSDLAMLVTERDTVLMVHTDQPFRMTQATPGYLYAFAQRFPETKILAAHLGGMLGLYTMHPPFQGTMDNLWFDTAVSTTLPMVKYLLELGWGERILFGTDFPFNHCHDQVGVVRTLEALGLQSGVIQNLFQNNAQALFGDALRLGR